MKIALILIILIVVLVGVFTYSELSKINTRKKNIVDMYSSLRVATSEQAKTLIVIDTITQLNKSKSLFGFNFLKASPEGESMWLCRELGEVFEKALVEGKREAALKLLTEIQTQNCLK